MFRRKAFAVSTAIAIIAAVIAAPAASQAAPETTAVSADDVASQRTTERTALIQQLRTTIEKHADRYAGLSTRGPNDIVIHLAAGASPLDQHVKALHGQAAALGIRVTVDQQKHSLAELKRVEASITKVGPFAAAGNGLASWGVNPDTNAVEIGVSHLTPELIAKARAAYGETVTLTEEAPLVAARGRLNDWPSFSGGSRIWGPGGSDDYCTFGFTVTDFRANRLALTAGHCFALNAAVTHNSYSLGNVSARSHGGGGVDSEFVWGASLAPRIWVGTVNTTSYATVKNAGDSCDGCQVYMNGSVTGQKISTLTGPAKCYIIDGYSQCNVQRVVRSASDPTPICQPGDSGGPVFSYTSGGVTATGIITAVQRDDYGVCYYTQISAITSYWGVTVTTG